MGWLFVFEDITNPYWRRASALMIGLPAMQHTQIFYSQIQNKDACHKKRRKTNTKDKSSHHLPL